MRTTLVTLLALLMTGCVTSNAVDFEGRDENVAFPTGRISFLIADAGPKDVGVRVESGGTDPSNRGWKLTLDGEVSRGEGSFDQRLAATETLQLHDVRYSGPSEARGRFALTAGSIHAHGHGFVNPHIAFDVFGGLAVSDMQVRVSGTQVTVPGGVAATTRVRDRTNRTALGPEVGVGMSIYPVPQARIYGRASYHFGVHAGDETELQRFEAGVSVEPAPGVSVFGAWRLWRYRADEGGSFHTDVEVDAQGPAFGLEFAF